MKLYDLGVFNNLELLKAWCETTPLTIFPKRKIGYLMKGYEASFLVVNSNPLIDINGTRQIVLREKQGEILEELLH